MWPIGVEAMKPGEDGLAARGKGVARRSEGRAVRSSRDRPPGRNASAQDATPASTSAPGHTARAREEMQGREKLVEERAQTPVRHLKVLRDELPNSRALRQDATGWIQDVELIRGLLQEHYDSARLALEPLKACGSTQDAALLAFKVADLEYRIEGLEVFLRREGSPGRDRRGV
jgi:hypothetical protein